MKCRVCGYEGPALKELFEPGVKISVKLAGLEIDACPECGVMQVANLGELHKRIEDARRGIFLQQLGERARAKSSQG